MNLEVAPDTYQGDKMNRYFFTILIFAATFVSCISELIDDGFGGGSSKLSKLDISVVAGSKHKNTIDDVKLSVYDEIFDYYPELASVAYGNGTFTVFLPESVDVTCLYSIIEWYVNDDGSLPDGLMVSNKNAKIVGVPIEAFKGNRYVDKIEFLKVVNENKKLIAIAQLVYSDSNVSVTGTIKETNDYSFALNNYFAGIKYSGKYTIDYFAKGKTITHDIECTYSVNLKKGWNLCFEIGEDYSRTETSTQVNVVYKGKTTSTDPVGMKWYIYNDFGSLFDNYYPDTSNLNAPDPASPDIIPDIPEIPIYTFPSMRLPSLGHTY